MRKSASSALEPNFAREKLKTGSERSFGLVFAVVFAVIALWPLLDGRPPRFWASILSAGFLLVALVAPSQLRPLNLLWARFGLVLQSIVTPLVMGMVFFVVMTPIALAMRLLGKDPLRLKPEPGADSYSLERHPPGPEPQTMMRQF